MDRIIAIDWSGAKARGGRGAIALAEVVGGEVARLDASLDRDAAMRAVMETPEDGSTMVALDFAFSLPRWYLRERGLRRPTQLWRTLVKDDAFGAESLIARCDPPFWGRPGKPRPHEPELGFRRADRLHGAKPVFQLGGAGSVGTGTLRGMPYLLDLRASGWSIWPFDPPSDRVVVEMYPARLYRHVGIERVRKASPDSRREALRKLTAGPLSKKHRDLAIASEHAFDAVTAALALWRLAGDREVEFPVPDALERVEGMIFQPE